MLSINAFLTNFGRPISINDQACRRAFFGRLRWPKSWALLGGGALNKEGFLNRNCPDARLAGMQFTLIGNRHQKYFVEGSFKTIADNSSTPEQTSLDEVAAKFQT